MQVIWKRPDGHHNSSPLDYKVVSIGEKYNLWLHKSEHKWFPFRVSGGWQDEDATQKLNSLVNLIDTDKQNFIDFVIKDFNHSSSEDIASHLESLNNWLTELHQNPKGDTWEMDIIQFSIKEVEKILQNNQDSIKSLANAPKAAQ